MAQYRWYRDGGMYVKSRDLIRRKIFDVTPQYFDEHIGNQTHYEGLLNLTNSKITSLGKLESVEGNVSLKYSKITSLGKLESVSGHIDLKFSNITNLGNLKTVDGDIYLRGVDSIESLGKLETVGGVIYCDHQTPIHDMLMNSKFKDQVRKPF